MAGDNFSKAAENLVEHKDSVRACTKAIDNSVSKLSVNDVYDCLTKVHNLAVKEEDMGVSRDARKDFSLIAHTANKLHGSDMSQASAALQAGAYADLTRLDKREHADGAADKHWKESLKWQREVSKIMGPSPLQRGYYADIANPASKLPAQGYWAIEDAFKP